MSSVHLSSTPAWLKIENPIVIKKNMNDKATYAEMRKATGLKFTVGKYGDEEVDGIPQKYKVHQMVSTPQFVEAAKTKGYDGIRVDEGEHHTFAVFTPEQVKSATGNKGAFDPKSPVITDAFNPMEPRDQGGRWTAGSNAGHKGEGFEFVSPNTGNLKFPEAVKALGGNTHRRMAAIHADVDRALGLKPRTANVIGAWADGGENSLMSEYQNPSWDQLVASASMKGHLARQKAVLIFKEGETEAKHGQPAALAHFMAKGSLEDIHDFLSGNGLTYHTLEPISGGAVVHVYAGDEPTLNAVEKAGKHYGSDVEVDQGRGDFIGTVKEDGTDEDQRADARAVFEGVIGGSGLQGVQAVWQGLRDRYGQGSETELGKGYSKKAKLVDGVIHTPDIEDAVRALYEKRKVELEQPDEVATLVDKLGKIVRAAVNRGEEAPAFNLCDVSVAGTNLFCHGNKDIPRVQMPQMDAKQTKEFRHWLVDKGYDIKKDEMKASHMRATLNQLSAAKAAAILRKGTGADKRLVVSKDNYILDGHHHWAAVIAEDAANNKLGDKRIKVARVNIGITKLLDEAAQFIEERKIGNQGQAADAFNPQEPRDQKGEWTKGGGGDPDKIPQEKLHSMLADAEARMKAVPDTSKIDTPERQALRQKIVDQLYNKDIGKRARNREATFILGLPGAGKSTFGNPLLASGAVEIDPDNAKQLIPEFNGGIGAFGVHEESSEIARRVLAKAYANGDNIVWS